jgi:site-specific recombinase XerD
VAATRTGGRTATQTAAVAFFDQPIVCDTVVRVSPTESFTRYVGNDTPTSQQLVEALCQRSDDDLTKLKLRSTATSYANGHFDMGIFEQHLMVTVGLLELNTTLMTLVPYVPQILDTSGRSIAMDSNNTHLVHRWLWLLIRLARNAASNQPIRHSDTARHPFAPETVATTWPRAFTHVHNQALARRQILDSPPPEQVHTAPQEAPLGYAQQAKKQRTTISPVAQPSGSMEKPCTAEELAAHFDNDPIPFELWMAELPDEMASGGHRTLKSPAVRKASTHTEKRQAETTFAETVSKKGKTAATLKHYEAAGESWMTFSAQNHWHWRIDDVPVPTRQRRLIQWLSQLQGLGVKRASTARKKVAAVRHLHISPPHLLPDPTADLPGLHSWLQDWARLDGPAQGALPAPRSLVEGICALLDPTKLSHAGLIAAFAYGMDLMGRSCEYLKDGRKTGLRMQDLIFRNVSGPISYASLAQDPTLLASVTELSFHIACYKNKNVDSTRSLPRSQRALCVVEAMINLLLAYYKQHGALPQPQDTLFLKANGKPLHRRDVSAWLKAGAAAAQLPPARFSSHSLRKGGASHMAASGVPDEVIQRLGRWQSDAYKRYIQVDAATLKRWSQNISKHTVRFELN